tara:strand:- start:3319 stop:4422 length:1104 start_codon:yes stop_codon:yes gene_type:complete
MKRGILLVLVMVFLINFSSAALGIVPAKSEVGFKPGLDFSVDYRVLEDDPNKKIILYAEGDLAEYVSFSKQSVVGGGSFSVDVKLPDALSIPGEHRILIVAEEDVDKEIPGIGTSLVLKGVIAVFVPYPGEYLEIKDFGARDVNAGDPVRFNMELINRGASILNVIPKVEIFSGEEKKGELVLSRRVVQSQEHLNLKKDLDTTGYLPGTYEAVLTVDYVAGEAQADLEFRLGHLFVEIVNHTDRVELGSISRFELDVESNWNNEIEGVYANVSFWDGENLLVDFKTSPTDLNPWEKSTLEGFFDSANFSSGSYLANMSLVYSGRTSNKVGEVKFVEGVNKTVILIIGGILIVLAILFWRLKNGKKKR